jgi:hypothetical protein
MYAHSRASLYYIPILCYVTCSKVLYKPLSDRRLQLIHPTYCLLYVVAFELRFAIFGTPDPSSMVYTR